MEQQPAAEVESLLKLHKDKPMHGIFYKHQEEHGLSQQLTFSFLRSSGLKSETEGFIMACQDGVFNTLVYRSRVMGINVPDARCRACRQVPETLMHLLSACRTYSGMAYVHRHNATLRVLYYHLRHSYGIAETPVLPYAPGDVESVVKNERCRIYWNYSFPTLELVQGNKPDIVLLDHQQKTMFVIEFSAPAEVNIVSKEEEKRTKYQELLGQLRRLWPDYAVSLLVMVIGSLGGMRNTLHCAQYRNNNNKANFINNQRRLWVRRLNSPEPQTQTEQPTAHNPAADVLPVQPATTKAGKPGQRLQWTTEMNKSVMHCYYTATKLETISTGYRHELHRLFTLRYPHLSTRVTKQRLIDQKRVITKNKSLTPLELRAIKNLVANQMNTVQPNDSLSNEPITETQNFRNRNNQTPNTASTNTSIQSETNPEYEHTPVTADPTLTNVPSTPTHNQGITPPPSSTHSAEQVMKTQFNNRRGNNPANRDPHSPNNILDTTSNNLPSTTTQGQNITPPHSITQSAAQVMSTQFNKWCGTNPVLRDPLPRLIFKSNTKQILHAINANLIPQFLTNDSNLEDIHTVIYSAAATTLIRSEKQFYQKIKSNNQIAIIAPPSRQELTEFWGGLWSEPKTHNANAQWSRQEEEKHQHITEQGDVILTLDEIAKKLKHTHNWKCPGVNNVQNFWYKQFSTTHEMLTEQINRAIRQPNTLPKFLNQGITYIKPKNADTKNPANYRPITCLPTFYKIITATICRRIEQHLNAKQHLDRKTKRMYKTSQGCKEQLIIDSVVMKQARKEHRNLHTCFIDYKKAFDSFLTRTMETWRTNVHLKTQDGLIQTEELRIRRGIFQGSSPSSLWFCLCQNPLSNTLSNTDHGFNIRHQKVNQHKINHLLYMDDLKLYAATEVQLRELLRTTGVCTSDVRMEFAMSKCKALHINKGQWKNHPEQEIVAGQTLDNMDKNETYKYLGFNQSVKIDHTQVKGQLTQEFRDRLIRLLKTKLNSRNLTKAINTFAIPVLTYSFGIIKWSRTDIETIHILIQTQLTKHRMSHPNAQIKTLRLFFQSKQTNLHKAIVKANKHYTPLTLSCPSHAADAHNHIESQQGKINTWVQKALHSKHRYRVTQDHINEDQSSTWLQDGQLFPETEGFMLAI
nr:unnamed protein product [Callosobruchus chinensis]